MFCTCSMLFLDFNRSCRVYTTQIPCMLLPQESYSYECCRKTHIQYAAMDIKCSNVYNDCSGRSRCPAMNVEKVYCIYVTACKFNLIRSRNW